MTQGPLNLDDADFWGNFKKTKADVLAWISSHDFRGVLIDAPQHIVADVHETIPVVGYFARSLRDDLVIDQVKSMLVVAVDLDTFQVRIGAALVQDKTPAPAAKPRHDPGEGLTVNAFEIDLRATLDLPLQSARYRVTVLLREFVSNSVSIDIRAATPQVSTHSLTSLLPTTAPNQQVDFHQHADSPALPTQDAIHINASLTASGPLLRGSYRIPVPVEFIVGELKSRVPLNVPNHASLRTVIPISIIVTGHDVAGPWVVSINAPSYEAIDRSDPQAHAQGYFTLSGELLNDFPQAASSYYVTAFSGGIVSATQSLTIPSAP